MVTFILHFNQAKVNVSSGSERLDQIWELKTVVQKHTFLVQFRIRSPKYRYFDLPEIEKSRIAFQNNDVISFSYFFGHCTVKK